MNPDVIQNTTHSLFSCSSWKLQAFLHKDFDFDFIIPLLPDTCPWPSLWVLQAKMLDPMEHTHSIHE